MINTATRERLITEGFTFEQIANIEQGLEDAKSGIGIPAREFHEQFRKEVLSQYA